MAAKTYKFQPTPSQIFIVMPSTLSRPAPPDPKAPIERRGERLDWDAISYMRVDPPYWMFPYIPGPCKEVS
jgi:hypothetical protein